MAVRQIVTMGAVSLLERSKEVETFGTPELAELIQDLWDSQEHYGGVGIAAPQIGVNLRVIVFGFEDNERYPDRDAVARTVLINPTYESLSEEQEDGWEGCLSVPGLRGIVPRYKRIRYSSFDEQGNHFEREAEDFHARLVQHEIDHIDGVLYPQRIKDMRAFGFEESLDFSAIESLHRKS